MYRLLLVDDEQIIRETIGATIDWPAMEIELVGVCENGAEAYDMILDEAPDIVITDIRMPVLDGLQLIERVSQFDHDVEFIILSGHSDFSVAQSAMEFGVKHYLLKPCNEKDIIACLERAKENCNKNQLTRNATEEQKRLIHALTNNALAYMLSQTLAHAGLLNSAIDPYARFIDFVNTPYILYYVRPLRFSQVKAFTDAVYVRHRMVSASPPAMIYANNAVMLFQEVNEGKGSVEEVLSEFVQQDCMPHCTVEHLRFANLRALWGSLLESLRMVDTVWLIGEEQLTPLRNVKASIADGVTPDIGLSDDPTTLDNSLRRLRDIILGSSSLEEIKSILLNALVRMIGNAPPSPGDLFEMDSFLGEISQVRDEEMLYRITETKLRALAAQYRSGSPDYKAFVDEIMHYVHVHLADPNLSLKHIAQTHLFMDVDYLSKQFLRQTGIKFSAFLNNTRIERAKQLLRHTKSDSIHWVAQQVGCGNNPKYFSQLFKKHTRLTPTEYIEQHRPGRE